MGVYRTTPAGAVTLLLLICPVLADGLEQLDAETKQQATEILLPKLAEIEARISKQDVKVAALFDAIRQLMRVSTPGRGRPIGLRPQKR